MCLLLSVSQRTGFGCILAVLIWTDPLVVRGATIEGTVDLGTGVKERRHRQRYPVSPRAEAAAESPALAVVYLEGSFAASAEAPAREPMLLVQRDRQFHPRLLPVKVGSTVLFPNEDETYHNVFSYSKTKRFDLGRYKAGDDIGAVKFDRPGVVKVFCEIHDHMRSTILVLDTPFFTTTDPNGKYRLENVASGSFVLVAWIDEKRIFSRPVEISPNASLVVDLEGP